MRLNWKSSWILGVVVLMLLASYVLQRLDGGGDGPPDVPDSELTPAAALTQSTPGGIVTKASDPNDLDARVRDLQADEKSGGHTIARHVGKSDDELRERLEDEPDISAASTYADYPTAGRVVQEVLDRKASDVKKWEDRSGSRPNLVLRLDLGEVIGRSIEQGEDEAADAEHAVVVLRWDGNGWFVLTSYPEVR
jgi:hypothetical protein